MKNSEEKARKAMGDAGLSNLIGWKQKRKNVVFEMKNRRATETVKFKFLNQKTSELGSQICFLSGFNKLKR